MNTGQAQPGGAQPNPFANLMGGFGGGMPGAMPGGMPGMPGMPQMDFNTISQMMQNPFVQNMMQQMMSNPALLNQVRSAITPQSSIDINTLCRCWPTTPSRNK